MNSILIFALVVYIVFIIGYGIYTWVVIHHTKNFLYLAEKTPLMLTLYISSILVVILLTLILLFIFDWESSFFLVEKILI